MIADSFEYSRSSDVCSTINGERIELNDILKIVNEKKIEEAKPCRYVSQGVVVGICLPKTAWPPTYTHLMI